MSATFHLYELDREIKCLGSPYSHSTKEEREARENQLTNLSEEERSNFYKDRFVKNGINVDGWDTISISTLKELSKVYKRNRLYRKYIYKLRNLGSSYYDTFYGYREEVLPVKEILYRQGWFVSKKFLNKECSWYFTTTKEGVERFFKLYLDTKNDKRGYEAREAFLSAWKDGMLFEAAF